MNFVIAVATLVCPDLLGQCLSRYANIYFGPSRSFSERFTIHLSGEPEGVHVDQRPSAPPLPDSMQLPVEAVLEGDRQVAPPEPEEGAAQVKQPRLEPVEVDHRLHGGLEAPRVEDESESNFNIHHEGIHFQGDRSGG